MLRFAIGVDWRVGVMVGKSPVTAGVDERLALEALAASRERGEADRARAVLLTLAGWTSVRIGEAFGVREDTVRLWRRQGGRVPRRCPHASRVFARVRERGYVTYNEVNAALPHDQVSSEFIEEVLTMLTKIGVSIVEGGAGDPEA